MEDLVDAEREMRWSRMSHKEAEGMAVFVESWKEKRLLIAQENQTGARAR